jgi:hypothetical protein
MNDYTDGLEIEVFKLRAKLKQASADLAAAHAEIEQFKKWKFDVAEGIGFCNRVWGVAGYEVADAETITGFWKDREMERDHEVESARRFSQAWKWWAKKRRRDLKWDDHRLVEVLNKNIELGKDLDAARKWAKAWKMKATGERIQKEQAAKAYCDEATNRELLQESNNTLRAEIERLNGRRCDATQCHDRISDENNKCRNSKNCKS